jgi:catechol 2,3-dioxygenase-like lactoylglutathione lyase family enzyme
VNSVVGAVENTFDHVGFITTDMGRTVEFWTKIIGLEAGPIVERRGEWIAGMTGIPGAALRIVHLFGEGVHLEFLEFLSAGVPSEPPDAAARCTGHVCIRVDDPAVCMERLLAAGATPSGQVTTITEGALAGFRGVYVRDPNGLLVEILQRKD